MQQIGAFLARATASESWGVAFVNLIYLGTSCQLPERRSLAGEEHAGRRANKQKGNETAEFTWRKQKIENKFLLLKGCVEKEESCW
jgi:hypothetical protein